MANSNTTQAVPLTEAPAVGPSGRPLTADHDYIGKGRVAACCAKRRYGLRPDADEMQELMNHAASIYWHKFTIDKMPPAQAFVQARDRTARYYYRRMRGANQSHYLRDVKLSYLEDPIDSNGSGSRTWHDVLESTIADSDAETRLNWLSVEDLEEVLVRGRRAAGVAEGTINRSIRNGTISREATTIRLAAQNHTNEGIATLLGTTEGTIRNLRQRIRRWLHAYAEEMDVDDDIMPWDKTGGNQLRSATIQGAYRGGRKPTDPRS